MSEISKRFPNSTNANYTFINTENRNEEFFTSIDTLWQLCSILPVYVPHHQNVSLGIMKKQRNSVEMTPTKNTAKRKKDFEQKVKEEELDIRELALGMKNEESLIENEQIHKMADDPVDEVNINERETTDHSDREQDLLNQIHELKKENEMLKVSMSRNNTNSKMYGCNCL